MNATMSLGQEPSGAARTPRYERPARRIAFRAFIGAVVLVLLATAAGFAGGWLAAAPLNLAPLPLALTVAAVAGFLTGYRVARTLSVIIGASVARPIEMIVAHLAVSGDDVIDQFASPKARRLNKAALIADEAFLRDRFARAEERARQLIAQLEEARVAATLQNAAKTQFLQGMSHELRTPLNAILGYAMLLHEDAVEAGNTAAISDLERIALSGRHLLALINNVLDLSRLETGNVALDRSLIDVEALIGAVVRDAEEDLVRLGATLRASSPEELSIMLGDNEKIVKSLGNLVRFAARHGGRNIGLSVGRPRHPIGPPNVEFRIGASELNTVFANAVGIPGAVSAAIADPMRTGVDPSVIDLQVAERLSRMMGGNIDLVQSGGGDIALRLSLPVGLTSGGAARTASRASQDCDAPIGVASARPDAPRSALVIDDNLEALDLMRRWLGNLGYAVTTAADGERGLAAAASRRFDVILLDVFMPGRSGYEVLSDLRASPATSETPVIMVTVDDDRARMLEAGATEHVRKPASEQRLRDVLKIYFEPAAGDVLVIEDNDDAAELIRRCAEQVGFSTRRASDGFEGLALAQAARPDAIVLDLMMPNCDGFAVMQSLVADAHLADVPVVVLSASEISSEEHRWIADAGYNFLAKGAHSPREIAAKLKELVA